MKKLSLICMTILAISFLASCRGPQGPAGHDGNANVASSTLTIKSSDWQWQANNSQWMVEIDYPAINNNVFNHGAVLVYMDVDGAWSQVPLTYYYQDWITNEENQQVLINCEASIEVATLSEMRPETHDFKVVAIEATVFATRSDVDYSSYEAVKKAFQLAED